MLNFEEFKKEVMENIREYLPEGYENAIIEMHKVDKVNQTLEGITIRKDDSQTMSPNLYLEKYYDFYQDNESVHDTIKIIVADYEKALIGFETIMPKDLIEMKDKVFMTLVNTEQNKKLLAKVPHREFQDLSVVYRIAIKNDDKGLISTKVTNELMEEMRLDEDELFALAAANTKELFPPKVENMLDIMKDMLFGPDASAELMNDMLGDTGRIDMWVISNKTGMNGATSMLYDETLHKVAEKVGADLYIMPSSIHEVIAVSAAEGELDFLSEMVHEANMSSVDLCERLSNNVYHYDKDLRKLTLATDVPNRRLDGIVAEGGKQYIQASVQEVPLVYESGKAR